MTYFISVEPTRFKDSRVDAGAPLIVREGRDGRHKYARWVEIAGPSVLMFSHVNPLPDGTRAWIETEGPIKYVEEE